MTPTGRRSGRFRKAALNFLALLLLAVGTGCLLVPAEAHGFPVGIPVTCGGPYRLLTGDWLQTEPEGKARFSAELRSRWEEECRSQAVRQVGVGVLLVMAGGYLYQRQRRT